MFTMTLLYIYFIKIIQYMCFVYSAYLRCWQPFTLPLIALNTTVFILHELGLHVMINSYQRTLHREHFIFATIPVMADCCLLFLYSSVPWERNICEHCLGRSI